jgi:hypothetical protein
MAVHLRPPMSRLPAWEFDTYQSSTVFPRLPLAQLRGFRTTPVSDWTPIDGSGASVWQRFGSGVALIGRRRSTWVAPVVGSLLMERFPQVSKDGLVHPEPLVRMIAVPRPLTA